MKSSSRAILPIHRFALAIAALCWAAPAADAAGPYTRIEEDWELVLTVPDPDNASPQIAMQMWPAPDSPLVGMFTCNHADLPGYSGGGGQIQLWNYETPLNWTSSPAVALSSNGEKVTWTQYMERKSGTLSFGVSVIKGKTWGDIKTGIPSVSCTDSTVNFTNYQSSRSVVNTEIVYGRDRVRSLKLVQVRKLKLDGKWDVEASQNVYP